MIEGGMDDELLLFLEAASAAMVRLLALAQNLRHPISFKGPDFGSFLVWQKIFYNLRDKNPILKLIIG